MDGLRQRGERWYAIVDFPRHPDGRRNRKEIPLGIMSKTMAKKRRSSIVAEIDSSTAVAPTKVTFGGYLTNEWLPAQKQRVAPKTYERWDQMVQSRIVPRLGHIALRALGERDLIAAYREWSAGKDGRALAPRTVLHIHRAIYHALKRAARLRLVARNVAENVGEELPRVERHEMQTLTEEQSEVLLQAARVSGKRRSVLDGKLEVPIMVAIDTGARRGELLALRWSDIDLEAGRLVIRRSLEETRQNGLRFKDTKTSKTRTNALDRDTVYALRRHRAKQNESRLLLGPAYQDNDLVFSREDGSPWNPDNFGKTFDRLIRRAKVPRVRLHDLRHTSATILLRQGVATKVVSERLGHSTTTLTTDTYQHVIAGMDAEAAAKAGQARREARARLSSA